MDHDYVFTEDEEEDGDEFCGLGIEERKLGEYECLTLILSKSEEKRIQRP